MSFTGFATGGRRHSALLLLCPLLASPALAGTVRIDLEAGAFRASPASPEATIEVFVDAGSNLPALLGSARHEDGALVFTPRFPLAAGMRFRVVYRASANAPPQTQLIDTPALPARPPALVEAIFPSVGVLPENQLKLYLQFSRPMSRGEAYQRIRLLTASGEQIEDPFLELEQELWDPSGRRLTLLFDPGRVKRALLPNEQVGPPLRQGGSYRLEVDSAWPDAQGRPLGADGLKEFRVGPPDAEQPSVSTWRLEPPAAGTRDPLDVSFPEPLDRALLDSALEVRTLAEEPVAGRVSIGQGETQWRFVPDIPWAAGVYVLRAASVLEDLAGNSLARPFEVDVFEGVDAAPTGASERLRFRVE